MLHHACDSHAKRSVVSCTQRLRIHEQLNLRWYWPPQDGRSRTPPNSIRDSTYDVCVREETSEIQRSVKYANTCAFMHGKWIPSLSPSLMSPESNSRVRQGCTPLRSSRSGRVPWPLTAPTVPRSPAARRQDPSGYVCLPRGYPKIPIRYGLADSLSGCMDPFRCCLRLR